MALTPEDGSIVAGADSYASAAYADAYWSARGSAAWAALSSDAKDIAIRRATDYMVQQYRTRWAGRRVNASQVLDWPRYDVPRDDLGDYYPSDAVPDEVKRACVELALKASAGDLLADTAQPVTEQTVGPITIKYAQGSSAGARYEAVDLLLAPFLGAARGGNSAGVVRG